MPKKQIVFNTSSAAILKIVLVLLALVFLYFVRDVVMILFTAVVISAALSPTVNWLKKRRVPRTVSVLLIYVCLLGLIALSVYLLIPPIAHQVKELENQFPTLYEQLAQKGIKIKILTQSGDWWNNLEKLASSYGANLSGATRSIFGALGMVFGGLISGFVILVLSFYLTVQEKALKSFIRAITPQRKQAHMIALLEKSQAKIGRWLSGQIMLCFLVGVVTFVGLTLLGVKYALVLALFAGLTELIPYIGPVLGATPAVFLALTQSPLLALLTLALFFIIQQLENHILVPKIMQKAVGLNPIVVILALLVGGKLAGVLGMILAVPIATIITVFAQDYMEIKKTMLKKKQSDM